MEVDTYTKTVERHYTELDGTEVLTGRAIDFLQEVEDTDAMFPLRWQHKWEDVADALIDASLVGRTSSGSWYAKDEDALRELRMELVEELMA